METLARNWWAFAARGVAAAGFMFLAVAWPAAPLQWLHALFGAYVFAAGMFTVVATTFQRGARARLWLLAFSGVLGALVGSSLMLWPRIETPAFEYVVASWALASGALELSAASRARRQLPDELSLGAGGVFAILGGAAMGALARMGISDLHLVLVVYAFSAAATASASAETLRNARPSSAPLHAHAASP